MMKSAIESTLRVIVFCCFLISSFLLKAQDFSAGINTETPNPNAVLHLVAPNGDQGVLIPTLTTVQRIGMTLTPSENGLMVFDTTEGLFYYYFNGWIALTTSGTELDGDPGNELITGTTFASNTLTITEGGVDHNINLSTLANGLADGTIVGQVLQWNGTSWVAGTDGDNDAINEIQDISTDATPGHITIAGGSVLTLNVDDADSDPTNEIELPATAIAGQVLEWNGSDWVASTVAGALPAGTVIGQELQWNGSNWVAGTDGDTDATNEIQDITTDATPGNITIASGSTLSLNVDDGDADPLNEIELPASAIAGQVLEWDGSAWVASTDDGALPAGTVIGQVLQWDGSNWVAASEGDDDSFNEIQDITTDATPGNITIASGSTLSLNVDDGDADPLNEIELPATAIAGQVLEWDGNDWVAATDDGALPADAVAGEVLLFDGANWVAASEGDDDPLNEIQDITTDATPGNITIASGSTLSLNVDDGDADPLNEIELPASAIAGQVLEWDGNSWVAATDDGMLAATYDPTNIAGDVFDFGTHVTVTTPTTGDVLTYTGTTWDAAPPVAGLTLPFSQSVADAGDLFILINSGLGGSGFFEIDNVLNTSNALSASTNGTGGAGTFVVNNAANPGNALSTSTNGTGTALNVTHSGTGVGKAVNVSMTSATATGPALSISHAGVGAGIEINATTGPPLFIPGGSAGDVLTTDGLGNITLQPGGGGFTAPLYDDLNNVVFGTATPVDLAITPEFRLGAVAPSSTGRATLFASSHQGGSAVSLLRANGSAGGETAVLAGDIIGDLEWVGYDGTGYAGQGMIRGVASANWGGGNKGMYLSFHATPSGSTIDREVMRMSGQGLQLNGDARINSPTPGVGGALELEDDGGANALRLSANPLSDSYEVIFPVSQGTGALTNDGTGNLSWSPTGFTAPHYDDLTNLVLGSATPTQVIPGPSFQLGAVAPATGGQALLTATSHGLSSEVALLRANGSQGGEAALIASDVIGDILFVGYDGTSYLSQGGIRGIATDNWTGATRGMALSFSATPAGSTVQNEVMRIGGNGVQINGIPRINNPVPLEGGTIQLEDDGGANFLSIQANAASDTYKIIFPASQGTGVLTNDGAGNLAWGAGGAFVEDANDNLLASTSIPAATTAKNNFIAGVNAGAGLTTGQDNIFIGQGSGSGVLSASFNIGLGLNAGSVLNGGSDNILIGQNTGSFLTSGNQNILIGPGADVLDDSNQNISIGNGSVTAGGFSTALGAASSATGAFSVAIGEGASATGIRSVALGAGVIAANDFTAVIGDPTVPINVGIGNDTPTSRLDVQTFGGESVDLLRLSHGASLGRALTIDVPVGGSPDPAMLIAQGADAVVMDLANTNPTSGETVINARHNGNGAVATLIQANSTSTANTMSVQTNGLGGAGVFQVSNTASASPALSVNTDGDNSNAISISKAGLNGAGIAIDMNGQGSNGLFIGGTNAGVASISTDGDINTSTDFNGNNMDLIGSAVIGRNFITPYLTYSVTNAATAVLPNTNRVLLIRNLSDIIINEITVAGAFPGQEILIIVEAAGTTFNVNSIGSGAINLRLDNDNAFTMRTGSTLHLMYVESLNQWVEFGRSF